MGQVEMPCTGISHGSVHVGFMHAELTHRRADVWALVMCQQSASRLLSVLGIIVARFKMLKIFWLRLLGYGFCFLCLTVWTLLSLTLFFFLYLWSHHLICSMTLCDALEYSAQNKAPVLVFIDVSSLKMWELLSLNLCNYYFIRSSALSELL